MAMTDLTSDEADADADDDENAGEELDADVAVPELDPLGREILFALDAADGGRLTTTDLKEQTGATNSRILYRLRSHLGPADLVETEQPVSEDGRVPPKRATITEKGRQVVLALDGLDVTAETGERTTEAELERLSAEVARLQSRVEDLEAREFDLLRAGMLGIRDFLLQQDHVDEETLRDAVRAHQEE